MPRCVAAKGILGEGERNELLSGGLPSPVPANCRAMTWKIKKGKIIRHAPTCIARRRASSGKVSNTSYWEEDYLRQLSELSGNDVRKKNEKK